MGPIKPMIHGTDLHDIFLVDYIEGTLLWKERPPSMFNTTSGHSREHRSSLWNSRFGNESALTTVDKDGYLVGEVLGFGFKSHRVIYAMFHGRWPEHTIDHINGDRSDNSISNLRDVTQKENTRNATLAVGSLSGMTGVTWNKSANRWVARMMVDGKQFYLGSFKDLNKAKHARELANREKGFHINHGKK